MPSSPQLSSTRIYLIPRLATVTDVALLKSRMPKEEENRNLIVAEPLLWL